MQKRIVQFIRERHRSSALRFLAQCSERYLRAWHNENFFDFARNGERFALNRFHRWWGDKPLRVWDVGANRGEWARLAKAELPSADVTSFEMIPQIYQHLAEHLEGEPWAQTICAGLSDVSGSVTAYWNTDFDTCSSITPRLEDAYFKSSETVATECQIIRGDEFAERSGGPDLIKVDTEGHEVKVLRGCAGLLNSDKPPAMIQFEYGSTFLPSGATLKQAFEVLEPAGYRIGRLHPNFVDFRDYDYALDNFRMGNFIAAHPAELISLLS